MHQSLNSNYVLIRKIGEGSFSEVLKVKEKKTGQLYAAKCLTHPFKTQNDVDNYIELKTLLKLDFHPNVLNLIEFVYDPELFQLTFIFNLMDMSLYDYIKDRKKKLTETRCKNYMYQLLHGLSFLHHNGVFHRDIKPENILIKIDVLLQRTNPLRAELVQLGDLGSVAYISFPQPRSEYISTRWYRAPECLLTNGFYGPKMDIFALGCCFYEMLTLAPLFPGENELDQLNKIHEVLGTPSAQMLERFNLSPACAKIEFPRRNSLNIYQLVPSLSSYGVDVLKKTLAYHPDNRRTAKKLLEHVYFEELKQKMSLNATSTRILFSKSECSTPTGRGSFSSIRKRSGPNISSNLSSSASFANEFKKSDSLKLLDEVQKKVNHQLERNWNMPLSSIKKNNLQNIRSSVINTKNAIE